MGRNKEMKESVVVSGKMMNHSKMETDSREKFLLILYLKFQCMTRTMLYFTQNYFLGVSNYFKCTIKILQFKFPHPLKKFGQSDTQY